MTEQQEARAQALQAATQITSTWARTPTVEETVVVAERLAVWIWTGTLPLEEQS